MIMRERRTHTLVPHCCLDDGYRSSGNDQAGGKCSSHCVQIHNASLAITLGKSGSLKSPCRVSGLLLAS